jgi:hypothetical protein
MIHFELAYYLQQQIDDEFYAIIDIPNNPKKMFLKQKLVNFEDTWYFHDNIKKTTKEPDLEYIRNFERKYQINLWKLAINERHFYRFNRFYKFTKTEILQFLEQECRFFERILEEIKPDYFLTYDPPFHYQKLLLDLCKAKGIKISCMYITRVGGNSIIASDGNTFDFPQNLDQVKLEKNLTKKSIKDIKHISEYSVVSQIWSNKRYPSNLEKIKSLKDYILLSDSNNTQSNFTYYGRTKTKVILDHSSFIIKKKIRERFMQKNLSKKIDSKIPYVYFPMNVEEEISTLHYTPFFTNQIEVIRHIAKSLPVGYHLYVKEHPHAVHRGWHKIDEYKEILDIPNVTLMHPSFSSEDLMKYSKLVITIRGTASFNCLYENKPSIVFGDVPFSIIPSVFKINSPVELPKTIRTALKTKVNPDHLQKYIKLIEERSINFSMMDWEILRNNQFFSNNVLSDIDIPEDSVKQFFDNTKEYFKPLLNAHLKILNS